VNFDEKQRVRLNSWKEIAGFLRVDVKTAQRWESTRGLPVRRLPGEGRKTVFAFQDEIEAWLSAGTGGAAEGEREVSRRGWWWAAAGAPVAGLGVWGWWRGRRVALANVRLEGQVLVGVDEAGQEVWRRRFDRAPVIEPEHALQGRHLKTIDWRGDGRREVLFNHRYQEKDAVQSELVCLSDKGEVRWQWPPELDLLDFDGRRFEQEWTIADTAVTREGRRETLWVSVTNDLRWSSAVLRFEEDGGRRVHFANHGYVMHLGVVGEGAEARILMAGLNNAYNRPFVAWMPASGPAATSPGGGPPRYRYANGPSGSPPLYILLPNSHFNLAKGKPYPNPVRFPLRRETVSVELHDPGSNDLVYTYEFDLELRPVRVHASSEVFALHRRYEREGVFDHRAEECPELTRPHVLRVWTPEGGWADVAVRVSNPYNTE
jgi:hypothetical protein